MKDGSPSRNLIVRGLSGEAGRGAWSLSRSQVPFWGGLALILLVHVLWEVQNDTPPVWDMAYHELKGWEYLQAWRGGELVKQFSLLSSYYPPLYYLQEAFFLCLFSQTQFLALLTNLLGLFLLAYCTFRIGALYGEAGTAQLTGLLPLLFPLVAWTTRESLLDVALSGWVAAAVYLILKSDFLQKRSWTFAWAGVLVAGMWTKWTFALFLCFPLLYALLCSKDRKRSLLHLADALIVAMPLIFWWYLSNLRFLLQRLSITWQMALEEGDPGLGSLLGWIYYPRSLSGYYLYLPLTILFLWNMARHWREGSRGDSGSPPSRGENPQGFLWCWLLGGLLLLMLLKAKDPRYVMPLVSPLALLLVAPWKGRMRWAVGIFLLAFLQFLTVSFRFPYLPERIALFEPARKSDYRSMRQEWVLYQSSYFEVAGPPRREEWHLDEILEAIPAAASVGFVPDLPRFHPHALQLYAVRRGRRQEVRRLGQSEDSVELLTSVDFVVGKSGFQGVSYITRFNHRVYHKLEELGWSLIHTWKLPDQSQGLLWRSPTPSR